ncbi:MAG TPA: sigma-70 family RNA polymerase sigma factor [Mycobacteriales bacterium]|nr:sigma-70 family RNA polymerase sigma factor [Mycobacteriales bacterium]
MLRPQSGNPLESDVSRIGSDPAVLEAFYRQHVDEVLRFVTRRVGDAATAADLTSDVFIAAIESARSFDPRRGTPRAWVIGIARIVVRGEHRRSVNEREKQNRIAGRRLLDDYDIIRLEERIDAHREARVLYQLIDRLPAGERDVLELVGVDGLSVVDAATALRISPTAARVRLHRARRTLRALRGPLHAADADAGVDQLLTTTNPVELPS